MHRNVGELCLCAKCEEGISDEFLREERLLQIILYAQSNRTNAESSFLDVSINCVTLQKDSRNWNAHSKVNQTALRTNDISSCLNISSSRVRKIRGLLH
mmetsp:Transcript_2036/g.7299  ORF Transcript_2036/g.7299 Transcript_2036/m.7299 type:complete len:99 (+) Transcript_2036:2143-2439(+)